MLAGDNVHAGATTISAGTLCLAHANALALTSAVTVTSGASLDVNGQPLTRNITLGGAGAGVAGALQNSSISASTLTGTVAMSVATLVQQQRSHHHRQRHRRPPVPCSSPKQVQVP